jgi:acetylornithine deacetylase/succinyl-diaminopimelate desuccinylase-like protein
MTPSAYLKSTKKERLNQLSELLRFPSVSAKSEHKKDMVDCANWLVSHLKSLGFKSKRYPTAGHPLVYAEYMVDPKLPTVLYYGHYDVQPVEPLELWKSGPFEPVIKAGRIVARGSADNKGQIFAHIKGLEAIIKSNGTLPVNVKMMVEGEEEIASENLPAFLKKNKKLLKSDICVVSDTSQFSHTQPSVTFGLRGMAFIEVYVHGPSHDVHSGQYGGAIANPVNVLCDMIGKLHDKNGKVAIPGFYKDVRVLTAWERKQFKKLPFVKSKYMKNLGINDLHGEKGFSTYERTWCRPTCDVNGITGGYQGEGSKTIIPAYGSAKISMRLVPNQDPDDITNKIEKYLKKIAPKSVRIEVRKTEGARAVEVPTEGPWLDAAARAIKAGFGKEPVFAKEGGSIPIVADFKSILGVNTLLLGLAQDDNRVHSPNENFRVIDFENGCKMAAALPFELAKVKK